MWGKVCKAQRRAGKPSCASVYRPAIDRSERGEFLNLEDPQIAHLVDLFNAAAESSRPREELMRVILGAALPIAGGDLAVVCGPDGETVASAPAGAEHAEAAAELARQACRALQNDNPPGDVCIAHLADSPPYVLAVRWARGRPS